MDSYTGLKTAQNIYDTTFKIQAAYQERASYDANGNILGYLRNGGKEQSPQMDSLRYKYQRDPSSGRLLSNRLLRVTDTVSNATYSSDLKNQPQDNYAYDQIGNLIKDSSERIKNITWSVYGKILEIEKLDTAKGAIKKDQLYLRRQW